MSEHNGSSGGSSSAQAATLASQQTIDVTKLAEKVYQLMQADARLAHARGQTRGPRR